MKKNNQYEINFASNTITVTKAFLQAASQMDTPEFATMTQLRALNMPITVREIHRVPKERRWSSKRMETYGYMGTWSWFKKTFANYKTAKLNENYQYITMTKEQMDAEKQKKVVGAFAEKASSSKKIDEPTASVAA